MISLRTDYDAGMLRKLAARSKDASQSRRLMSLAAVHDGMHQFVWLGSYHRYVLTAVPSTRRSPIWISNGIALVSAFIIIRKG